MKIDEQKIIDILVAADLPPSAKELGADLCEKWIARHLKSDLQRRVLAVECGFHIWIDDKTLVVGMQDGIFQDENGTLGGEWKSKKAPRVKLNGEPYKGDTEEDWLLEISTGPQLAIYALAQHAGIFYEVGNPNPLRFDVPVPRIMVRAAIKSNPPSFWPEEEANGIFTFQPEYLDGIESALLSCAKQIRGARRDQEIVPWQLPGKQCFGWGRECQFLGSVAAPGCVQHCYPIGKEVYIFNPNDPAFEGALKFCDPKKLENPELVVLSASSYQLFFECAEKFRQITGHGGEKDESEALATGSALHLALAEYYRQVKGMQK
jgi:hypothetical protein